MNFPNPTYEFLAHLTSSSLAQANSLAKSLRIWSILRSLYGSNEYKLDLQDLFTFADWYELAIEERGLLVDFDFSLSISEITIENWFHSVDLNAQDWFIDSPLKSLNSSEIEHLLKVKPFERQERISITNYKRKIKFDFEFFSERKYLVSLMDRLATNRVVTRYRKDESTFNTFLEQLRSKDNSSEEKRPIFDHLINEYIVDFAFNFKNPIAGIQRFFLDLDYVIPQKPSLEILKLQNQLRQVWEKTPSSPIRIDYYSSSKQNLFLDLVVYPVCIYYSQRACYLCAFGQSPEEGAKWYNYRLDKIQSITELSWNEPLPEILSSVDLEALPEPFDIEDAFNEAWGFDFYQAKDTLLLRFPKTFHELYIMDTERHTTFELSSYDDTLKMIHNSPLSSLEKDTLIQSVSQNKDDAYYTSIYRMNDNKIIMRLRAWGPNVEVLLPWNLRQRIADDIQETSSLYL